MQDIANSALYESVYKMGLVISITFLQYMGLHVLNWPIRIYVIERIYL